MFLQNHSVLHFLKHFQEIFFTFGYCSKYVFIYWEASATGIFSSFESPKGVFPYKILKFITFAILLCSLVTCSSSVLKNIFLAVRSCKSLSFLYARRRFSSLTAQPEPSVQSGNSQMKPDSSHLGK